MSLSLLAQTAGSQCTLNGQPVDCAELAEKAKPFIGLGIGIFVFIAILAIASFIFWLVMLLHAINHKSPDRSTWILALVVGFITGFGFIVAVVYLFAEKKKAEEATDPTKPEAITPPQKTE